MTSGIVIPIGSVNIFIGYIPTTKSSVESNASTTTLNEDNHSTIQVIILSQSTFSSMSVNGI
jgi:hypothetical protein